jgi:hypothetical protein
LLAEPCFCFFNGVACGDAIELHCCCFLGDIRKDFTGMKRG